jgi:hypothetical protein
MVTGLGALGATVETTGVVVVSTVETVVVMIKPGGGLKSPGRFPELSA